MKSILEKDTYRLLRIKNRYLVQVLKIRNDKIQRSVMKMEEQTRRRRRLGDELVLTLLLRSSEKIFPSWSIVARLQWKNRKVWSV
jgi:hypothetical protein